MKNNQNVIAVFDFDGTLTKRDSLFVFLRAATGPFHFWLGMLALSPIFLAFGVRLIPNWKAKELVLSYFLKGWPLEKLCNAGRSFVELRIPHLLKPNAVDQLRWHQKQGHAVVIVSATLEIYLKPWAEKLPNTQAAGTKLDVQEGIFTGRIAGKNCYGPEKLKRLQSLLGDLGNYCIYVYGDSKGDEELLRIATYPHYRTF